MTGGLADTNRKLVALRFGRTASTFFAGTLMFGIIVDLALSVSVCAWNLHIRCFSIARDMLVVISFAARTWFLAALVIAILAALIEQIYRTVAWWNALIVVPVSILSVSFLPLRLSGLFRGAMFDPFTFLGLGLVLFAGFQFSRFISKLVDRIQQ